MTENTASAAARETARLTSGQFGEQKHTAPELHLTEIFLDDESDGSDFDLDAHYDVSAGNDEEVANSFDTWSVDHRDVDAQAAGIGKVSASVYQPNPEEEAALEAFLEEERDGPQGIDEYFNRPEPELVGSGVSIGSWGSAKPF